MSKETNFSDKIKALKASKSFIVTSESDRRQVCRLAKMLKRHGLIEFNVVTRKEGDAFKVAAI